MGSLCPTTELAGTMMWLPVCLLCSLLCSLVQTQSDSLTRPLVDPEEELTILETCTGVPDGTRCTKRCIHWSCDPKFARCYKGHCKRAGHHPCSTPSHHPCCCGSCENPWRTQRILIVSIASRNWAGGRRRRATEKLKTVD